MSQTPDEPIYLTVKQAAELLQLSTVTIYRHLALGDLPAVKVCGQWRLSRKRLDDWITQVGVSALEPEPSRQVQVNGTDPAR